MIELGIVFVLVVFNGFFALSEMAVITSRKSRLKQMALTSKRAQAALKLAEHPESFLSAVQVWITLLGLLTGFFGGESIGGKLSGPIAHIFPMLAPYSHWIGFAAGFLVMVFLYGVIGELLPKRIGTLHSERIATAVALPMKFFATIATPGVIIMSGCTSFLMRIFRVSTNSEDKVTDEEIRHLVAESHEQGMIDSDERNMLNRVLRLGDRSAESLMTPRTMIIWLDTDESTEENLATLREHPFTRYPVCHKDDSNIVGILESKSLVGRSCDNNDALFQTLNTALFVSESTNALRLLEIFREEQQTLALVVDEYGDIMGMVTMNDLIGAILGRIQSLESTDNDPLIVEREDSSWLVDGRLAIEELSELLNLQTLPGEDDSDFTTVAGMVIAHFGRIPHAGEHFDFGIWRVEVVDLDGARIDKLLIGRKPDIEPAFDE
jgi:putative hemolysin